MTGETKRRMNLAALNAAEMMRGHAEVGFIPNDIGELDEYGVIEYGRACERIALQIDKLAKKYEP